MSTPIYDGGPAFPLTYIDKSDPRVIKTMVEDGMSLRDYLAAHAPEKPWNWYRPTIPPKPKTHHYVSTTGSGRCYDNENAALTECGDDYEPCNKEEIDQWHKDTQGAYERQWPYFYADAILAERSRKAKP